MSQNGYDEMFQPVTLPHHLRGSHAAIFYLLRRGMDLDGPSAPPAAPREVSVTGRRQTLRTERPVPDGPTDRTGPWHRFFQEDTFLFSTS